MVECEYCTAISGGETCTLFETTLLMLGWTVNDEPVIKVTLPWGVVEDFQVFTIDTREKTYYEPGNETNFRTVVYVGRTQDWEAVFKICKPAAPPECAELSCINASCKTGESVALSAILSACFAPELKIGGKTVKFYLDGAYKGSGITDGYSGLAEKTITAPPSPGTYTISAEFAGDADWGADNCTATLTVISAKEDTSLTSCSATYSSGIVHFYATLKDEDGIGLFNKPVKFFIDNVHVDTGYSYTDGSVSEPYVHILSPGTYAIKAEFVGDGSYNASSCTATLPVEEAPTCEYTGHASDAKIDHDDVPSSAGEGSEVTGTVSVDCIEVGETRYRVKWILDGGTPAYSNNFLLGYIGEHDESCTFTMPDHDVTLIAEVERCNASGEWEPCEHADHIKTYSITRALYDGPYGVIVEGYPKLIKNSNEYICTNTCEDDNPCTADKGAKPEFKVVIKNAGNEKGYFYVKLTDSEGNELDTEPHGLPAGLEPGETTEEILQPIVGGPSMPDSDWGLQIKIVRTGIVGDFKEWNDTKPFMVCYKQVVDHYSVALNDLPDEVHTGDKITFSGTLSHDAGGDVSSKLIEIMEKDIDPDDFIAKGTTGSDGTFAIPWTVKKVGGWLEGKTAEFYARFKFNSKEVTSNTVRVSIVGPSITKAIIYGGIAVGLFAVGSVVGSVAGPKGKAIGVPVKLCAIAPVSLAGWEGYKIIKEKIPLF